MWLDTRISNVTLIHGRISLNSIALWLPLVRSLTALGSLPTSSICKALSFSLSQFVLHPIKSCASPKNMQSNLGFRGFHLWSQQLFLLKLAKHMALDSGDVKVNPCQPGQPPGGGWRLWKQFHVVGSMSQFVSSFLTWMDSSMDLFGQDTHFIWKKWDGQWRMQA